MQQANDGKVAGVAAFLKAEQSERTIQQFLRSMPITPG